MLQAILAGFMIGIGGIVNLTIGNIAGAVFFSVGLLSILHFKFFLFTGKAGLLVTKQIAIINLIKIWFGNLIGTATAAIMYILTPTGNNHIEIAKNIVNIRINNGFLANIILGIFCGILMYIAVTGYNQTQNVAFVIIPVAAFILAGFNHCVADMFYLMVNLSSIEGWITLIFTTIGNIVGCNLIPFICKYNLYKSAE